MFRLRLLIFLSSAGFIAARSSTGMDRFPDVTVNDIDEKCRRGKVCTPHHPIEDDPCHLAPNCEYRWDEHCVCAPEIGTPHAGLRIQQSRGLNYSLGDPCVPDHPGSTAPCELASNCEYRWAESGNCAPFITQFVDIASLSVVNVSLGKRVVQCGDFELVNTLQFGVNYINFGTYEPQWAAHSTMYDICQQNACIDNQVKYLGSKWVWAGGCAVAFGNMKGHASGSGYPGWDDRNAFAEAMTQAAYQSQVSWDSWYSNSPACQGNAGWSKWTEWKAIDWYQSTAFYKGKCEDGSDLWVGKSYTKMWFDADHGSAYSHNLCNAIINWAGALASKYTAGMSKMIGRLLSTQC